MTSLTASSLAHSAGPASVASSQPLPIDQQRGRHAERLADRLEVLEHLGAVVGVVAELRSMPTSFSQVFGFSGSRVSMLTATTSKLGSAELGLQRVERRHLLAAGHAPGRPQVEQHGAAAPVGQRLVARRRASLKASVRQAFSGSWPTPTAATSPRASGAIRRAVSTAGRQAGATAALPCRRPIPYTPASPTATPATPPSKDDGEPLLGVARVRCFCELCHDRMTFRWRRRKDP